MFIASTRPHTCISSRCQGYRLVLRRLYVASYTYGYGMPWRHESAVTVTRSRHESAVTVTRSHGIQRRLRHIHVKKLYIFCVRVCTLSYQAYKSVRLYHIFPHYVINGMIFGKKKKNTLNIKCVFWSSLQFATWNVSHSKKDSARYCHICTSVLCKVPVVLVRF